MKRLLAYWATPFSCPMRISSGAFASLTLLLYAAPLAAQHPTVKHVAIESAALGQTRELMVFEPMNYAADEYAYYDVIYVFDAQTRMLFDYVSALANLSKEAGLGLLVVGVRATAIAEDSYYRNHDLLPADTGWNLPGAGGNAEAFLAYVKDEVVPYVESTYRTLPHRTAVGHSLSASFAIYAMLNEPDLFDNVIAVSPNLSYDDRRLIRGLRSFDSGRFESSRLLYVSHANEAQEGWASWGPANAEAYALLRDTVATDHFQVVVEEYRDESHMSGFMPSVASALGIYFETIRPEQTAELSGDEVEVTFRVTVPEKGDELYVTGNQASLGDDPSVVRMERVSPYVRELTVRVRDHVELSLYGAEGATAWIATGEEESWGRPKTTFSRMIRPVEGTVYEFEVVGYQN